MYRSNMLKLVGKMSEENGLITFYEPSFDIKFHNGGNSIDIDSIEVYVLRNTYVESTHYFHLLESKKMGMAFKDGEISIPKIQDNENIHEYRQKISKSFPKVPEKILVKLLSELLSMSD